MDLNKFITQLSEEKFQTLHQDLISENAEKTAALIRGIRGNSEKASGRFLATFEFSPKTYYWLSYPHHTIIQN